MNANPQPCTTLNEPVYFGWRAHSSSKETYRYWYIIPATRYLGTHRTSFYRWGDKDYPFTAQTTTKCKKVRNSSFLDKKVCFSIFKQMYSQAKTAMNLSLINRTKTVQQHSLYRLLDFQI